MAFRYQTTERFVNKDEKSLLVHKRVTTSVSDHNQSHPQILSALRKYSHASTLATSPNLAPHIR
jgi:hypothetical protein